MFGKLGILIDSVCLPSRVLGKWKGAQIYGGWMGIKNVGNESTMSIWLWESISIVQEDRKLETVCSDLRDYRKTFCD